MGQFFITYPLLPLNIVGGKWGIFPSKFEICTNAGVVVCRTVCGSEIIFSSSCSPVVFWNTEGWIEFCAVRHSRNPSEKWEYKLRTFQAQWSRGEKLLSEGGEMTLVSDGFKFIARGTKRRGRQWNGGNAISTHRTYGTLGWFYKVWVHLMPLGEVVRELWTGFGFSWVRNFLITRRRRISTRFRLFHNNIVM